MFTRRTFLAGGVAVGAGLALVGPRGRARAQAAKPLLIGLTCDATGAFAAGGQADRRGMILAIEEQNARGGVLGRSIEHTWEDTESDPTVAARKAQRLIERDRIDFMTGGLSSPVAARLSGLAQRYGIVYLNSNASADSLTNAQCQRTSFSWDATDDMFARALAPLVTKSLGKRWLILTHADAWGRTVTAATRESMKNAGASETGEISIAPGTRDFTAQLLRVRATKPAVVMVNVAGAEQAALREQARDFGADKDAHWVFPPLDYPDLYALGARRAFGYFATTWHSAVTDPGAQDFVQRFRRRWTGAPIEVACNVSCNGYLATRELFRAIERAGTTKSHDVIKALEGHAIKDNFRKYPSRIREWDHLLEQMVYLVRAKRADEMKDQYDLVEPVADLAPATIAPPRDASRCKMPSFLETAVYGS